MKNVQEIQPFDFVFTSSSSMLANAIRFITVGWKQTFDRSYPNHSGIAVPFGNATVIAEMLDKGIDVNSIHDYNGKGPKKDSITHIMRPKNLTETQKGYIVERISHRLLKGKKYDWMGVFAFVIPGLEDRGSMEYCSEMAWKIFSEVVLMPADVDVPVFDEKVSPYALYKYLKTIPEFIEEV